MASIDVDAFSQLTETEKQQLRQHLQLASANTLSKTEQYTIWFFGTVVASIVPVVCAAFISGSWMQEIYNGQLIISAVGVYGAAAGGSYLLTVDNVRHRNIRTFIAMSAIPFIAAGAMLYQSFSSPERGSGEGHSDQKVAVASYLIGGLAILSGLGHVYIASEANS